MDPPQTIIADMYTSQVPIATNYFLRLGDKTALVMRKNKLKANVT